MNRRARKKEETRSNIIDCAVDLFKENGFDKTSMEKIADIADVSKGTLYNYFQDKESILIAYFQSSIADYGQEFRIRLKEVHGIQARLNFLLDFIIDHILANDLELGTIYLKFRMRTLLDNNPFDNPQRSGLENFVLEIMNEAQENKEIRGDIPALVLARNFQFLARSYLIASLYANEPMDMSTLRNQLIDIFLNGVKQ